MNTPDIHMEKKSNDLWTGPQSSFYGKSCSFSGMWETTIFKGVNCFSNLYMFPVSNKNPTVYQVTPKEKNTN